MPLSSRCVILGLFQTSLRRIFANIWICSVLLFWTLLFLPWGLCIVCAARFFRWQTGADIVRKFSYYYGRSLWWLLRPVLPVHIKNRTEALRNAPCIIVCNHQSFLDLFLLGVQDAPNFCYLSKSWPYKKLFFFAPIMRYMEYIDVETTPLEELEQRCYDLLKRGISIVVFPEGQRSRNGTLGSFHAGAFRLACGAQVAVVPFVIHNSGEVFAVGGRYFTPTPIHITMLEAVHPQAFTQEAIPHRAMMRAVREAFVRVLQPRQER